MTTPQLLTTAEVAAALGLDESRVRRLARSRSVGQHYGRAWLFTPAEVEAMRERKPGRPAKSPA